MKDIEMFNQPIHIINVDELGCSKRWMVFISDQTHYNGVFLPLDADVLWTDGKFRPLMKFPKNGKHRSYWKTKKKAQRALELAKCKAAKKAGLIYFDSKKYELESPKKLIQKYSKDGTIFKSNECESYYILAQTGSNLWQLISVNKGEIFNRWNDAQKSDCEMFKLLKDEFKITGKKLVIAE